MAAPILLCIAICAASTEKVNGAGRISRPQLTVQSPITTIGRTETIHCLSRNASLPITYILFINKTMVAKEEVSQEGGADFSITIYNETRLGPYKCKAVNNGTNGTYSEERTFILREEKKQHGYLSWLIPILLLLSTLIIITVYIGYVRHKKDGGITDGDELYCAVVVAEGSGAIIRTEEAVEYMQVAIKRS
ncbi:allergin-1 [Engystomops pustulosus]|uniref:allergin-1 n=1 Tax=Engystomops pustulosus TaxID=76066 RepID=UPI003AFAD2CD